MMLRPYQQRALDMLYAWFRENQTGNVVLNMPGGSGKSIVIAALVKDAIEQWNDTKILMLVHDRKLIRQNAAELKGLWNDAPLGVYSAGLNMREHGQQITYAGIQSIGKKAHLIGHTDLCIIDEVHAVSNEKQGLYRKMIDDLLAINPYMRVVGLSASPFRMNQGLLTDGDDSIFKEILEPVSIEELLSLGHLLPLVSKATTHRLETKGLHIRAGDYISKEMDERFNTIDNNQMVVKEASIKAADRKHWLVFCSSVQHSMDFAQCLTDMGIPAHSITTKDSPEDEDKKLSDFESGRVRALCNFGKYTTGYNFPALDCILFLRGIKSPGLYLQAAVRGMRVHEGKKDCLVLDFAGVVQENGPITALKTPKKAGKGDGEMATKECPDCAEILLVTARSCPACGHEFTSAEKAREPLFLRNDDILGIDPIEMRVTGWSWNKHIAKSSGKEMLRVTYFGNLSDQPIKEHFAVAHDGYAGIKSRGIVAGIAQESGVGAAHLSDLEAAVRVLNRGAPPQVIRHIRKGGFPSVVARIWGD